MLIIAYNSKRIRRIQAQIKNWHRFTAKERKKLGFPIGRVWDKALRQDDYRLFLKLRYRLKISLILLLIQIAFIIVVKPAKTPNDNLSKIERVDKHDLKQSAMAVVKFIENKNRAGILKLINKETGFMGDKFEDVVIDLADPNGKLNCVYFSCESLKGESVHDLINTYKDNTTEYKVTSLTKNTKGQLRAKVKVQIYGTPLTDNNLVSMVFFKSIDRWYLESM